MLLVIVIATAAAALVYGALRILAGLILPRDTMVALDRFLGRAMAFLGKLFVVLAGLSVLWLIWAIARA